ncbi:ribonuclease P protein component [Rhizosphaericola mali]|uniref:Ribonuclease P protein component n=1 Tax=Rhizosphaericola mali TaxID=2545455 RepID=A0A5P2G4P0_9BACT|nr:ribonuclease P protein component [Rhizosphaericola mali]QES90794.1 ribonuclease P protein component [Rhizosphaericola mali]
MERFTYKRSEKLKSRKQIELLFIKKQSISIYPIRISYLQVNEEIEANSLKVGVGTSKRNFKKAIDRNRVKRLLRESYRLYKLPLHKIVQEKNIHLIVFFHYYSRNILSQTELHKKMELGINKIVALLHEPLA